ncbi:ATP-dependent DNA ligase [Fomitiporia mediterranea MF3/22]|uniref:ATP-dependent DNA ligase n=1 Tax=Fomitiporia mediterranea (strain MF3/22) TaxID=694068 RepID=UPI00044088DE|nr:ATP-dependent DNA ligase [Fomitiporia mediterranea MF3/22]EJD03124.1 ATP-dependent DNA ligase [Fomitiporia mediterranea MF3/22]
MESPDSIMRPSSSNVTVEDDEAFALGLAAAEGINLETLRTLEQKWKTSQTTPSIKQPSREVIDVDAADNVSKITTEVADRDGVRNSPRQASHGAKPVSNANFSSEVHGLPLETESLPNLAEDPLCLSVMQNPWADKPTSAPEPAPYSFLAHTLCSLSGTRSRISIYNILTNALRFIIYHDPSALLPALYLLSNSLAPPYTSIELGLGPSTISSAIQHVSGLTPAALKRLYTKSGDAGDVAFEAKSKLRTLIPHASLTVTGVYSSLLKICYAKGAGATKQRQSIAEKLLLSAKGEEIRYLVRTMSQHIRVGAVRTSILTALARALVLTRPANCQKFPPDDSPYFVSPQSLALIKAASGEAKKKAKEDPLREKIMVKFSAAEGLVKRVYVQHPNFDHIAKALLEGGPEELAEKVTLTVGLPLHHTLGSPTRSLDEVYDRLGNLPFTAEFKYDGQRAQIHARKNEDGDLFVRIFSRHLEEMTDKYPDIVALVEEMFRSSSLLRSFIIDTEIVAIDAVDGSLRTFQELSNRARKDVRLEDVKIKVCVYAFDLMFLNEESLLEQPFRLRRQKLRSYFPPIHPSSPFISKFDHVECCESEEGREAVEEFWQKAVDGRSEGLMIKLLDSREVDEDPNGAKTKQRKKPLPATYEPDKRTLAWLKLKKDYVLGLGDSLDLVPIGAWHGNGRKAAWWSPILLAVWDEGSGQLVGVCKCMSGFTDEFYKSLQERYAEGSEACSRTSLWNVNSGGYSPEVYFKPQEVWEIRGADITLSPVSVAALGLVSQDRGLSLRFPRFMRVRDDKAITDANTPEFLASMWHKQESRGRDTGGMDDGDLIDASPEVSEGEEDDDDEDG